MYKQQVNIYTDGRDMYIRIADGWKKIHGYLRKTGEWIDKWCLDRWADRENDSVFLCPSD